MEILYCTKFVDGSHEIIFKLIEMGERNLVMAKNALGDSTTTLHIACGNDNISRNTISGHG